jgi:AbrB family looped-hinge helix DNA binding protein
MIRHRILGLIFAIWQDILPKLEVVMETTLDKFGRIVIPKRVRDDLGLKPGAVFKIEQVNQKILMKPVNEEPRVVVKNGVLVFSGTATGDLVGAIQVHRQKRLIKAGSVNRK